MSRLLQHGAKALMGLADSLGTPRLSIAIFHRVLPRPDPLFPGEMCAARFDALCAMLASCFQVLTLRDAVAALDAGRLPPRALVVTFDDGYADNATVAVPIMRKHGLKGTFFVATSFLDGGRMWNDSVIECIRRCQHDQIHLPELGLVHHPLSTDLQRRAAIDQVIPRVKYMPLADREEALEALDLAAGSPPLPGDLMMESRQVRALHEVGMEIGGHTVRHPILRSIDDADAANEIRDGRACLQRITGGHVESFAYPNGAPDRDYDFRHVAMVREAGFSAAVSTARGVVLPGADRLQLPRFSPWDQEPLRWLARLASSRLRGDPRHQRAQTRSA